MSLALALPLRFFRFLCWILSRITPVDAWSGSRGTYVAEFRGALGAIADNLSRVACPVRTRYNVDGRCAEFYTPTGDVIARVSVHGELGSPSRVKVALGPLFLPEMKHVFAGLIPGHVYFTDLEGLMLW